MRIALLIAVSASLCLPVRAQLTEAGDGTRLNGTISFTCTPDEKSKAAGAKPFDDTLELVKDQVMSKVLRGQGFPATRCTAVMINGISTFTVTFKKDAVTATYFVRAKQDGAVSGTFNRTGDDGKSLRYTIGATFLRNEAGPAVALSPDVLRMNGQYVRLLSVHIAIAEAGVKVDKNAVNALLKALGDDHNLMRVALVNGEITREKFLAESGPRLAKAWKDLSPILGNDDAAAKVEAAYYKPYTSTYVYLNQMRAAALDVASGNAAKQADRAVYQYLVELGTLGRQPTKRTPEAIEDVKKRAMTDVLKSLEPEQKAAFEAALNHVTSTTRPTTSPVKIKPA